MIGLSIASALNSICGPHLNVSQRILTRVLVSEEPCCASCPSTMTRQHFANTSSAYSSHSYQTNDFGPVKKEAFELVACSCSIDTKRVASGTVLRQPETEIRCLATKATVHENATNSSSQNFHKVSMLLSCLEARNNNSRGRQPDASVH